MKRNNTINIVILVTALLIGVIGGFALFNSKHPTTAPCIYILSDNNSERVLPWLDPTNQEYYVFLPSYATPDNISAHELSFTTQYNSIIDLPRVDHLLDSAFALNISNTRYPVHVVQSRSVHTLFLSLGEENLEKVNSTKGYTSSVCMRIVDTTGQTTFCDSLFRTSLRSRGNTTWYHEKKPYTITLDKPQSLLGMTQSTKWVLLANTYDPSNLRNKIIYDVAGSTFSNWSPRTEYVDLYINGRYQGLYLLSEKIEVSDTRLSFPGEKRYLFTMISDVQAGEKDILFCFPKTKRNAKLEYPQYITPEVENEINHTLGQFESVILDGMKNPDKDISHMVDLDSWAQRYLIDEISVNLDCGYVSSYFYYTFTHDSCVVYAGPIWDYDRTFGCISGIYSSRIFVANEPSMNPEAPTFSSAFMHNKQFQDRVKRVYKNQFRSQLIRLIDQGIDHLADSIGQATAMNNIRWHSLYDQPSLYIDDSVMTPSYLKDFLLHRLNFLDSVWVKNLPIYNVKVQTDKSKTSMFSVTDSIRLAQLLQSSGLSSEHYIWKDIFTGKTYSPDSIINSDVCLAIVSPDSLLWKEPEDGVVEINWSKKNMLRAMWMPLLMVLLGILYISDRKRNKIKRNE